ncbi:MAG TPA: efflux RND transporter periplasmic adaptor subunit [Verrucomicrobiae bacterium]|jgi:cobalt-zinc-cadmium efflux system membrane fusion protein|nr:efflux RND transporter periplasmic adaptor subunit [Verrucomicrobiae bacterium]
MLAMGRPCHGAEAAPARAAVASNLVLTAAQRQKIHTETLKVSTFHRTIETTATVDFDGDQATTILAPIGGPVIKLAVSLGAKVKAGDILATVASPDYATAISTYRKAVATAKNARRIAELTRELSQNNLSRREVEQAQTDAANAEADREAALEQLRSLGVDATTIQTIDEGKSVPERAGQVRSPIEGIVVEKLITPGQLLQAGTTPCFTVADLSLVWVMANIFESDLAAVQVGDPAEVITSASETNLLGVVDYISAIVDTNTRSIGVRVVATNSTGVLKKQMYVRVLLHSRREQTGLLCPVSSVLRDDEDLPFVYLSNADASFSRRRITLGSRVGDSYEIRTGLAPGDQVVVEGGLFLQFMQAQ